jgi:hypothetical protein
MVADCDTVLVATQRVKDKYGRNYLHNKKNRELGAVVAMVEAGVCTPMRIYHNTTGADAACVATGRFVEVKSRQLSDVSLRTQTLRRTDCWQKTWMFERALEMDRVAKIRRNAVHAFVLAELTTSRPACAIYFGGAAHGPAIHRILEEKIDEKRSRQGARKTSGYDTVEIGLCDFCDVTGRYCRPEFRDGIVLIGSRDVVTFDEFVARIVRGACIPYTFKHAPPVPPVPTVQAVDTIPSIFAAPPLWTVPTPATTL